MADIQQITSGTQVFGAAPLPRGRTVDIDKVPRYPGALYWDMDTKNLYVWDAPTGAWQPVLNSFTAGQVFHDGSLYGRGISGDLLEILEPIEEYDPSANYRVGNAVSMHDVAGYKDGIYRLDDALTRVWQKYNPKQLRINVGQIFSTGDQFYVSQLGVPYSGYNGVYFVNNSAVSILITPTDVTELEAHIANGDITWMTDPSSSRMTYWQPNQAYNANDWVYRKVNDDPTLGNDYSVIYQNIISLPSGQPIFNEFEDVSNWTLLADIQPPDGGIVVYGNSANPLSPPPYPGDNKYLYINNNTSVGYWWRDPNPAIPGDAGEYVPLKKDVVVAQRANWPAIGFNDTLYVDADTGYAQWWNGGAYVDLKAQGAVETVNLRYPLTGFDPTASLTTDVTVMEFLTAEPTNPALLDEGVLYVTQGTGSGTPSPAIPGVLTVNHISPDMSGNVDTPGSVVLVTTAAGTEPLNDKIQRLEILSGQAVIWLPVRTTPPTNTPPDMPVDPNKTYFVGVSPSGDVYTWVAGGTTWQLFSNGSTAFWTGAVPTTGSPKAERLTVMGTEKILALADSSGVLLADLAPWIMNLINNSLQKNMSATDYARDIHATVISPSIVSITGKTHNPIDGSETAYSFELTSTDGDIIFTDNGMGGVDMEIRGNLNDFLRKDMSATDYVRDLHATPLSTSVVSVTCNVWNPITGVQTPHSATITTDPHIEIGGAIDAITLTTTGLLTEANSEHDYVRDLHANAAAANRVEISCMTYDPVTGTQTGPNVATITLDTHLVAGGSTDTLSLGVTGLLTEANSATDYCRDIHVTPVSSTLLNITGKTHNPVNGSELSYTVPLVSDGSVIFGGVADAPTISAATSPYPPSPPSDGKVYVLTCTNATYEWKELI